LKPGRWGSPLFQEKYQEENACDNRHNNNNNNNNNNNSNNKIFSSHMFLKTVFASFCFVFQMAKSIKSLTLRLTESYKIL
jgi:hypothetical protein